MGGTGTLHAIVDDDRALRNRRAGHGGVGLGIVRRRQDATGIGARYA